MSIISGRDMEPGREGGTWLALGHHDNIIKVGALLNMPGHDDDNCVHLGRGPIVANYVKGTISNTEYCDLILHHNYKPFNFVTVELE
jgi:hypothetical protein